MRILSFCMNCHLGNLANKSNSVLELEPHPMSTSCSRVICGAYFSMHYSYYLSDTKYQCSLAFLLVVWCGSGGGGVFEVDNA